MEKLKFDRKCHCDWCNEIEICAITHYGTTEYNRLICVECAMSINCSHEIPLTGKPYFDLNNSTIVFGTNLTYDIAKEKTED